MIESRERHHMDTINITPKQKTLAKLLTALIPIKIYRKACRGILQLGIRNYKNIISSDKTRHFKYNLSITSIMKNEGRYLKEWLDYHILVGVNKFYLYDNESTDNTTEILKPYIEQGIVDYVYWPGKNQQSITYVDSLKRHKQETKYMAIIDLDEFIVPVNYYTVPEYLATLPDFAQLVIGWEQYGSSGYKHAQPGLLIENYKKHADKSWGIKSIVNPRLVTSITNPHAHNVAGFIIDENGKKLGRIIQTEKRNITTNKIRCNHYVTKSFDEYIARMNQGSATTQLSTEYRSIEKFKWYDRNEVYDDIMDKYIDALKKTLD